MATQPQVPQPSSATRARFNRILFATDFSQASRHAQRYAVALARLFGSRLLALHVEGPSGSLMPYSEVSPYVLDKLREARDIQMRMLQESLQREDITFACMLETGDVKEKINEIIREHSIDLIVLGTHGRQGLSRVLMGSIVEDVFRSTTLPVLTVGRIAIHSIPGNRSLTFCTPRTLPPIQNPPRPMPSRWRRSFSRT